MQKEINLKVLFNVIKKRLLLIFILTAITTTASGYYSMVSEGPPPIYESSASILLNMDGDNEGTTIETILREPTVLNSVVEELGLNKTLDELNDQIYFINEGGSIVKIMVADTNPELAANIANSTANIFIKQLGSILGMYEIKILSEAVVSNTPSSVVSESTSLLKYLVIGLGVGLVLSIGIVLFLDSLDETVQSEREIEKLLELPALGYVSKMDSKNTETKPGQRKGLKLRGGTNGT